MASSARPLEVRYSSSGRPEEIDALLPAKEDWPTLPDLPRLTGPTILEVGRRFFEYPPLTILKLGAGKDEALMTSLAHQILGSVLSHPAAMVSIASLPDQEGVLLAEQGGTPVVQLWPGLSPAQRTAVKNNVAALLVQMREPEVPFEYYGRPGLKPYTTPSEFRGNNEHDFCRTRSEWDASRVKALKLLAADVGLRDDRLQELERAQSATGCSGAPLVDRPVLTHGDLSDRNILIDPSTLQITGLIDWEMANIAPAHFEYVDARLSGGHEPEWRIEVLDIVSRVLRIECAHVVAENTEGGGQESNIEQVKELFEATLAEWRALVDVERAAQGYSDDCCWTFEDEVSWVTATS